MTSSTYWDQFGQLENAIRQVAARFSMWTLLGITACNGGGPHVPHPWAELVIAPGKGVVQAVATADERFVLFTTTGPGPLMVVTDTEFRVLRKIEDPYRRVAVGEDTRVIGGTTGRVDLLALPTLDVVATARLPDEEVGIGLPMLRFCADGWLYVNMVTGDVVQFTEGLDVRCRATTGEQAYAMAVDGKTGRVIVCGSGPAKIMAPGLTAVVTVDLGGEAQDIVAAEGNAWVAMADGTLACVAMAEGTLTSRTPIVPADGRVWVSLDQSGPEFVGCWMSARGRDDMSIVLKVFRCDNGKAVEVATHSAEVKRGVNNVTLLRRSKRVVVCAARTAFVWHYGTSGGNDPR